MNLLGLLENGLFALGQVLRFPVMVLLWACVVAAVFVAGACVMDVLLRRRERSGFRLPLWLKAGSILQADTQRIAQLPSPLRSLVQQIQQLAATAPLAAGDLENLILEREENLRRGVNLSRALVKVGPSLGLIGTLVPMGASLASLASGNLQAMAGQMVVAFTTTIIGLAAGTLAYVVTSVRQGWVNETVREQRYLAERIASELGAES